jgi:hypothetical protein
MVNGVRWQGHTSALLLLVFFLTWGCVQSPVPIEGTSVLLDITAARVSDTTIVVCYRINSTVLTSGYCRAGSVTSAGVSFGCT